MDLWKTVPVFLTLICVCAALEITKIDVHGKRSYLKEGKNNGIYCNFKREQSEKNKQIKSTWYKDGKRIQEGYVKPKKDECVYEVTEVSFEDEGLYNCSLLLDGDEDMYTVNQGAFITVYGKSPDNPDNDLEVAWEGEECSFKFKGGFAPSQPDVAAFCGLRKGKKGAWIEAPFNTSSGKNYGISSLDKGRWNTEQEGNYTRLSLPEDSSISVSGIEGDGVLVPVCVAWLKNQEGKPFAEVEYKPFKDVEFEDGKYANTCPEAPFEKAEGHPSFKVEYGKHEVLCRSQMWGHEDNMRSTLKCLKKGKWIQTIECSRDSNSTKGPGSWFKVENGTRTSKFTPDVMGDLFATCDPSGLAGNSPGLAASGSLLFSIISVALSLK